MTNYQLFLTILFSGLIFATAFGTLFIALVIAGTLSYRTGRANRIVLVIGIVLLSGWYTHYMYQTKLLPVVKQVNQKQASY